MNDITCTQYIFRSTAPSWQIAVHVDEFRRYNITTNIIQTMKINYSNIELQSRESENVAV